MAEIRWTAEAQRWLGEIYDFISKNNPAAAIRTVEAIYDKAQGLLEFPSIGYRYSHQSCKEIRILIYGHYRIAYTCVDGGDIHILGVFHQALDIERYL